MSKRFRSLDNNVSKTSNTNWPNTTRLTMQKESIKFMNPDNTAQG